MEHRSARHRVAIAVPPRLLGETLSRALTRDALDIVVVDSPEQLSAHYDIVVVCGPDEPAGVTADVIVHLPEYPPRAGVESDGSITTVHGRELVDLRQVADISSAIKRVSSIPRPV